MKILLYRGTIEEHMTPTGTTYQLTYTLAMVKDAIKTFVWRRGVLQQKGMFLASLVMTVAWFVFDVKSKSAWVDIVYVVGIGMPWVMLLMLWGAHYPNIVNRFKRMREPVSTFRLDEQGLHFASDMGSASMVWHTLVDVWECPDYWLLFWGPATFNILPIAGIAPADLAYLKERVHRG